MVDDPSSHLDRVSRRRRPKRKSGSVSSNWSKRRDDKEQENADRTDRHDASQDRPDWLRLDADSKQKPIDTLVFSDEADEPIGRCRTAWVTAVLKAHGIRPDWSRPPLAWGPPPRLRRFGETASACRSFAWA